MKCEYCGKDMYIADNDITSDEGSTDVYCVQEFVCTDKDCVAWVGNNTNNPLKSVKGLPIKLN